MNTTIQRLENRLIQISQCLALTSYAEDMAMPLRIREEGRQHRQLLEKMLVENRLTLESLISCHA